MIIPEYLYAQIQQVMPIPCVDLLVSDAQGRVLLVKRKKEPAAGQWWFPGVRVHYLETRESAALRKLKEECGLESTQMVEMGTYDVILDKPDDTNPRHGITTLFRIAVNKQRDFILDAQSSAAEWWCENLHPFVKEGKTTMKKRLDKKQRCQC